MTDSQLIASLTAALAQADLYLNSYDTSAPSRIKAETRAAVEEALGFAKNRCDVVDYVGGGHTHAANGECIPNYGPDDWEGPPTPEYREDDMESYDEMVRDDLAGRP